MTALSWVPTGSEVDPCCCGECCLYPWPDHEGVASPPGPYYPGSDLPTNVEVTLPVEYGIYAGTYTVPLVGVLVTGYSYEYSAGDVSIYIYPDTATLGWFVSIQLGEDSYTGGGPCLISTMPMLGPASIVVDDLFEDIYSVLVTPTPGGPFEELSPVTTLIQRQDACCWVWSNPADVAAFGPLSGWMFCFDESFSPVPSWVLGPTTNKDNPQSSPVGDYTLGDDAVVTVSVPPPP